MKRLSECRFKISTNQHATDLYCMLNKFIMEQLSLFHQVVKIMKDATKLVIEYEKRIKENTVDEEFLEMVRDFTKKYFG